MTPILLLLALMPVLRSDPQTAGTATEKTATIRGRVTDEASGQPIARALIRLMRMNSPESPSTVTDAEGRYEFTDLAAGQYGGFVEAGPFRRTHIRQGLIDPANPAGLLTLKAGEVREDVNIALARGLAITVRIVDEWGGPLAGLSVQVKRTESGRIAAMAMARSTDDQGRLRVYGLAAGRYVVCAQQMMIGISGPKRMSERERFVTTCYPSAASEAEAEAVVLENTDIEDLPILMRRGRTFRVSGTVVDSTGAPVPAASVGLEMEVAGGSTGSYRQAANDGTFSLEDLAPGNYTLTAGIGGPNRPEHRREPEAAYYPFSLGPDSGDLDGIVLRLARTVSVRGRILLDDPAAPFPRAAGSGLFITARQAGSAGSGMSGLPAHVGQDRTFLLEGISGSRILNVYNVPRGWYVKSMRYENKEIFGVPTEFKPGPDRIALEVLLSARGAVITGQVTDEVGEPVREGLVLMVPAGKARWSPHESSSARISRTGTFRLGPQRGGDYFMVALPAELADVAFNDQERLARLAQGGERITLRGEEERTLDLRIVKPR